MKYILMIAAVLFTAGVVFAQQAPRPDQKPDIQREAKAEMRAEVKADKQNVKQEFKAEIQTNKNEFKAERVALKEEWRNNATRTPAEIKEKIQERREAMKDRRQEIKARLASTTKEVKARFDETKKERIKGKIANVSGKFDGAIARMEAFDAKANEAVKRFKERGIDTANSEALLVIARESLADVKKSAAEFEAKALTIVAGDEVSRLALREEAEVIIQGIKDTHAAYVDVVVELKASGGAKAKKEDSNATTTATTSNETATTTSN